MARILHCIVQYLIIQEMSIKVEVFKFVGAEATPSDTRKTFRHQLFIVHTAGSREMEGIVPTSSSDLMEATDCRTGMNIFLLMPL